MRLLSGANTAPESGRVQEVSRFQDSVDGECSDRMGLAAGRATLPAMTVAGQVEQLLSGAFPDGEVSVVDFGGGDHLSAHVRSTRFSGLSLLDQHSLVYAPVQHLIDDGSIHALKIRTEAPV